MRHKLYISILAAGAVLLSCSGMADREAPVGYRFIIRTGQVRTCIENVSGGTYASKWSKGDSMGAFFGDTSVTRDKLEFDAVFSNTASGGRKASFEGSADVPESGSFYGFYPAAALERGYAYGRIGFNIGDKNEGYLQHPLKDSFDPDCDLLLARRCDYTAAGKTITIDSLYFTRPLSILKINLTGTFAAGEKVDSFKVISAAGDTLGGRVSIDYPNHRIFKWTAPRNYVQAAYESGEEPLLGSGSVYLIVNPTTVRSGSELTFLAHTKGYSVKKTVTLAKDISFPAGNIATINLAISEENCTDLNPGSPLEASGGWLEMPAIAAAKDISSTTTSSLSDLIYKTYTVSDGGNTQRNYSVLYDPEMYASYWVAYPLCSSHMGSLSRKSGFPKDPEIDADKQTDIENSAYGANFSTTNYQNNVYSRGHQLPSADRNGNSQMLLQAYYATNITPQIQNGFNGSIWNQLESAIRSVVPSGDTLYVVTGAAFRKPGGSEKIKTITNKNDKKILPLPNYYWKVLLKVRRSGTLLTGASAIGVWLPHTDLKGETWSDYVVSVNQIESFTGFDFFANLPEALETSAESNTSWTSFEAF